MEIVLGLALLGASGSILIHDWFADWYCAADELECASWAAVFAGVFLGVPTLFVGLVTRCFPQTFWYGQALQSLLFGYVAALQLFG